MQNNRQDERVPIKLRVDCKCKDNYVFEYSKNLSQSGIYLTTKKPLPPGTKINLQFSIDPDKKKEINILGQVIWVNKPTNTQDPTFQPGMGIKFINTDEKTKDSIKNLIKRIAVLKGVI